MDIKAVLFDLDGTLLDTIDDLADSMNIVLSHRGYPTHDVDKYKYFIGDGAYNLVLRALPEDKRDKQTVESCFSAFRMEYNNRIVEKTHPYPDVPKLLDSLQDMGIRLCILSNKPDEATRFVASRLLAHWKFDAVFGERPGVPRKPDPSAALEIADMLGIKPQDFLYLGDSGVDMKTANAAGMYPVGASWGFRTAEELEECSAKLVIESPLQLLEIFKA